MLVVKMRSNDNIHVSLCEYIVLLPFIFHVQQKNSKYLIFVSWSSFYLYYRIETGKKLLVGCSVTDFAVYSKTWGKDEEKRF